MPTGDSKTLLSTAARRAAEAQLAAAEKFERIDPELVAQLFQIFSTADAAVSWLTSPAAALDGRIPVDVAVTKKGIEQVCALLNGISYGMVM